MKRNGMIQMYPLVRVSLFLIAGMLTAYGLRSFFVPWHWLALTVFFCSLCLVFRKAIVQSSLVLIASWALGGVLMCGKLNSMDVSLPAIPFSYKAVVLSPPVIKEKVVRCDLCVLFGKKSLKVSAAFIRSSYSENLHVGDGLIATSLFEVIPHDSNPSFNNRLYMQSHGYVAQTLILADHWEKKVVELQNLSWVERTQLAALVFRDRAVRHLSKTGLQDDELAIVSAVTLGDKSMIHKELKQNYSISGASHVLALSGLHLGIIYFVLSLSVERWRKRYRSWVRPLSECVMIIAIWTYVLLVGMSPSVVRSATMITVYSLMSLQHRRKLSLNVLAFTAIVMLMMNPMNLFDIGFQLSMLAVLSIIIFYPRIYSCVPQIRLRFLRWLWQLTTVSIAAQLGVAPLTAYYFGQVSCCFILTNWVVVVLTTLIIYLSLFLFVFCWMPVMQSFAVTILSWIVGTQNRMLNQIASLPGTAIQHIHLHWVQVLMIYVIILAVYGMIQQLDLYRHGKFTKFAP